MPWGDGTGPVGYGPMTGRGAGYCSGFPGPGYANPYVPRMGMGWGARFSWRGGYGRRWGWWGGWGWGRGLFRRWW